jgi:prepilin-type N-terminal cleavage/methylation domain-containing protein
MDNINMKKNFGFTLVELLVVMGMIGLLASIMLVGLNSSKEKARDSVRMDDLKSLSKAAELYFVKYGDFPVDIYRDETGEDVKDYFTDGVIPTDPKTGDPYEYAADNDNPPKNYCIGATMEVMSGNGVTCGGGMNLGSGINYIVVGP